MDFEYHEVPRSRTSAPHAYGKTHSRLYIPGMSVTLPDRGDVLPGWGNYDDEDEVGLERPRIITAPKRKHSGGGADQVSITAIQPLAYDVSGRPYTSGAMEIQGSREFTDNNQKDRRIILGVSDDESFKTEGDSHASFPGWVCISSTIDLTTVPGLFFHRCVFEEYQSY